MTRSQQYIRSVKQSSSDVSDQDLDKTQDMFYHLRPRDITRTETQVDILDRGIKRAWFSATNKKPIFFDLAFNYVDLPMDDLERAAGKEVSSSQASATTTTVPSAIGAAVDKLPESIRGPVEQVVQKAVPAAAARLIPGTGVSRGRESTPAPEMEVEEESEGEKEVKQPETPSKGGWFGGLFGGRK